MPVPSSIDQLNQTPGSNAPAGSESPALLDDYIRTVFAFIATLRDGQGYSNPVNLASAATTDIGAQTSPVVRITGTTTITSFGGNYAGPRFLVFGGALTLTHNAASLVLPGGANIATAAGDTCIAIPNLATPTGWVVLAYQRAALVPGAASSLVGSLSISQGGTGQATALAAFDALKQAASTSYVGAVELATDAEAQAATDFNRAVTPDNLGATVLGIGQSWNTQAKAVNITYTNSTGRPIMVMVSLSTSANDNASVLVNGVEHARFGVAAGLIGFFSFVVPNGATYRVNAVIAVMNVWSELR
ncbi:hypothetical protein [uncultured Hydrogenophaga sp.]|uniref:hypothetical protein n=1 Tax=uncultured Hydrogenophaga sp. TaxID=199683 RepID=UPI0025873C15|nr:hypothetical protein [uncultured Hydrogenophaga sp.]